MQTEIEQRVRDVKGPRPVLSKAREKALTTRQREILDELSTVFDEGFNHLTMADLAGRLNCSLRTLYGLAPSRDELVTMVVDRNLWRIGRSAMQAVALGEGVDRSPVEVIRVYLEAANMAVADTTEAFAVDCAATPITRQLNEAHSDYLIAVTRSLLDLAVEQGDIAAIDTAAVARVVAGLGADFARPEVLPTLQSSPKEAADAVLHLMLDALLAHPPT